MKKTLTQLIPAILFSALPLLALAHGGEEEGGAETAIQAVPDPEQRMYVTVGIGIVLLVLAVWFFYSRRAK